MTRVLTCDSLVGILPICRLFWVPQTVNNLFFLNKSHINLSFMPGDTENTVGKSAEPAMKACVYPCGRRGSQRTERVTGEVPSWGDWKEEGEWKRMGLVWMVGLSADGAQDKLASDPQWRLISQAEEGWCECIHGPLGTGSPFFVPE